MKYQGSYCALITPFKDDLFDEKSFIKIIKWHIKQGTKGIVPCGTTGESPTLSHDEHKKVIDIAVQTSGGALQVIAGTGSNSTKEAVSLTKHAKVCGADSALVVVPYYNKPSQEGLINHFLMIAETVDLPIFIYNIPGRSAVDMSNDTIQKLSEHENIIGIKDASNDLSRPSHLKKYIKHKKFFQLSGEDATQLGFLAQGGDGVISVTANIVPKKVSDLHQFWFSGDILKAMEINTELLDLNSALFLEANPCPVKYAASKLGLCNYELRLPLCKILKKNEKLIDDLLQDFNINFR